MFAGDAEEKAEDIILGNGFDLSAEVLKAGHHGSETSSSDSFVDAVGAKIAVISVGEGNKYNHPNQVTLDKYANRNIQTYRTDLLGTITLTIDGTNIVTSFDESFAATNSRSASFIYAPNIAEVDLNLEHIVDEDIVVENSANQK
jgi:competence protein ComEC